MFRKALMIASLGGALLSLAPAYAHDGATGIVKERMEDMKVMGQATKGSAALIMGGAELNIENLNTITLNGAAIKQRAQQMLAKFPEGSLSHASEAKSNIWTNWQEFSDLADKLTLQASTLTETTLQLEQIVASKQSDPRLEELKTGLKGAFEAMVQTCKDCHTDFREKKH